MKMYTTAMDLDGIDQSVSGDGTNIVLSKRVLWESAHHQGKHTALLDQGMLIIPTNAVYNLTAKIRLKSLTDCSRAELAVFKAAVDESGNVVDGGQHEYWFVLDEKPIVDGGCQLSGSDMFDFLGEDRVFIGVILYGDKPMGFIDGSSNYTAWSIGLQADI